ncbi:MAG: TonB-dependent receptor, partial [Tannerella sp.]|nr:TonB-dependent receptor [Tannerella sp.]
MRANKIQILAIAVLSGVSVYVEAQEPDNRLNREMTLEREYDPTVQDASKVNRLPEVKDPEVTKRPIDYSPFTVPADPEKDLTVLPSGSILTEIPYNRRRGYFHFGGGMFMNLNGDAGYHLLDTDRDLLKLYLAHHSTNGEVEYLQEGAGKQNAFLNDNLAGLGFRHRFASSALHLGAEYGYTGFNYYGLPLMPLTSSLPGGWDIADSTADRSARQANQTVHLRAGIQSKENAKTGYTLDVDWVHFSQKFGQTKALKGISEDRVTGLLDLNFRLGEKEQRAGITARLNYFNYVYPFVRTDALPGYRNYLETTLTPYYRIDGETWHVKLGANVMLIGGDSSRIFVSPDIAAEMQIADRTVFYVNAGGEIGSNDAYGLSRRNRYMDYFGATLPSRTWLDATAGIRSSVTRDFRLHVFAGYRITENEVFFIPADRNVASDFGHYITAFQPDVSEFRAGAAVSYSWRQQVDFSLKGVYHNWSFSEGDEAARTYEQPPKDMKAYGRPALELHADVTVKPVRPLTLTLGYYLGAERYTLVNRQEEKMGNLNDLNLTAAWNFNDTFGVYAKLNNLLFQKQELWA